MSSRKIIISRLLRRLGKKVGHFITSPWRTMASKRGLEDDGNKVNGDKRPNIVSTEDNSLTNPEATTVKEPPRSVDQLQECRGNNCSKKSDLDNLEFRNEMREMENEMQTNEHPIVGNNSASTIRPVQPYSILASRSSVSSNNITLATEPLHQDLEQYDHVQATDGDAVIHIPNERLEILQRAALEADQVSGIQVILEPDTQQICYDLHELHGLLETPSELEIKTEVFSQNCSENEIEEHIFTDETTREIGNYLEESKSGTLNSLKKCCICLQISFDSTEEENNLKELVSSGQLTNKLREIFLSIPTINDMTKGNLFVKEIAIPNQLNGEDANKIIYTKCSRVNSWFWTIDGKNWMHVAFSSVKGSGPNQHKEVPHGHKKMMEYLDQYNPPMPSSVHQKCPICKVLKRYDLSTLVPKKREMLTQLHNPQPHGRGLLRNIVLIGKTGNGKSSTGNTILGSNKFKAGLSSCSVTQETSFGKREFQGRDITVVDTAGFDDTNKKLNEFTKEIVKCVTLASQGIHALIFVLNIGRFTLEDQQMIEYFMKVFGERLQDYLIIVFTHADNLDDFNGFDKYISDVGSRNASLKDLLTRCGNRFIPFNNKATGQESEDQVMHLVRMVESLVDKNGGQPYTEKYLKQAEVTLQEEIERRLKENIKSEPKIEENLRNQFRMEILKETAANKGATFTGNLRNMEEEITQKIVDLLLFQKNLLLESVKLKW